MLRPALPLAVALAACTNSGADTDTFRCDLPSDDVTVNEVEVRGPFLRVNLSYSGGCEDHAIVLWWRGVVGPSDPPSVAIALHHEANGDTCEAWITEDLWFDLTPLDTTLVELGGGDVDLVVGDKGFVFTAGVAAARPADSVTPLVTCSL